MDIIEKLQDKNNTAAYRFLLELEATSAGSDELYSYFEKYLKLLSHKSSFVRVRGFRMCCAQAQWDSKNKLEHHIDSLLTILDDDKPTAVRQCLSALHTVILYKPDLCGRIEEKLRTLNLEKYKDSMRPLIEKDIEELRKAFVEVGLPRNELEVQRMKGFHRDNQLFSLCGLNCGLCPMHLNKYCPGCGGGEGNQSCKIAKCSLGHNGVEYCFQCSEYPCEKYKHIDDFDSFITHHNQKADLKKAKEMGVEAYNAEQVDKTEILNFLLANYNDGRKKNLFCVAVNLLELQEINGILMQIESNPELEKFTFKEQCSFVAGLFQNAAKQKNIELKLRKKK